MKLEIVIGKALRRIRQKREKSQQEVKQDTGINVYNYECSFRMPRADTLIALIIYYELNFNNFVSLLLEAASSNRSIERMIEEKWKELGA